MSVETHSYPRRAQLILPFRFKSAIGVYTRDGGNEFIQSVDSFYSQYKDRTIRPI